MAEDKDLADLMKEFVAALMTYLRQRGQEFITDLTLKPLRKIAGKLVLLTIALTLFIVGAVFLGIFMVLGFSWLCGGSYTWGYLCAGLLVLAIALIVLMVMGRAGESKKEEKRERGELERRSEGHGGGPTG